MRKLFLLVTFIYCFCPAFWAEGQTVEQLRKERKEIQERINATNKLLQKTQKDEKVSIRKLNMLRKNLDDRKKLISGYNAEIRVLDGKINQLTTEKTALEKQLEALKADYAKLIQHTQMNRNTYSKLMFLLSAQNFDQTLRRARHLYRFSEYRKNQVADIEQVKKRIVQKTDSLGTNKTDKLKALKTKEQESNKLKKEQDAEKTLLASLRKEEQKLAAEYKTHQRKRDQIDNKIQQVIAEEIRKAEAKRKAEEARRKAEANRRKGKTETAATDTKPTVTTAAPGSTAGQKPASPSSVAALTREEQLLMGGFANNRGRLPWPVDRGMISGRFGTQPHPELKHVTINNKGTYFRSPSGTNARAVYDGVVTRRFALPGSGSAVIVQHGTYRTVYGNLSAVYVREGEKIKAKQPVGKIFTDEATGQAVLQFQIWSGSTMLNPESWITR